MTTLAGPAAGVPVRSLAFAPDGQTLAAAGADRTVALWDVGSWKRRAVVPSQTQPVACVAYSPDGKLLAVAAGDTGTGVPGVITIFDTETLQQRAVLTGHTRAIETIAFGARRQDPRLVERRHDRPALGPERRRTNSPRYRTTSPHEDWTSLPTAGRWPAALKTAALRPGMSLRGARRRPTGATPGSSPACLRADGRTLATPARTRRQALGSRPGRRSRLGRRFRGRRGEPRSWSIRRTARHSSLVASTSC